MPLLVSVVLPRKMQGLRLSLRPKRMKTTVMKVVLWSLMRSFAVPLRGLVRILAHQMNRILTPSRKSLVGGHSPVLMEWMRAGCGFFLVWVLRG